MADSPETEISPTRTHATWKPGVIEDPIPFYSCSECSAVFVGIDGGNGPRFEATADVPSSRLPYAPAPDPATACGGFFERLATADAASQADRIELSYDVVGGFDSNALRVFWDVREEAANRGGSHSKRSQACRSNTHCRASARRSCSRWARRRLRLLR